MNHREIDILQAERLVAMIRKEANLTSKESRYLTVKLDSPVYDFNELPADLLAKLRESCRRLNITYKGERI